MAAGRRPSAPPPRPAGRPNNGSTGNGTYALLLINFALFFIGQFWHPRWLAALPLSHWAPKWWQFVTATFVHANWEHLSSNAFSLLIFGRIRELARLGLGSLGLGGLRLGGFVRWAVAGVRQACCSSRLQRLCSSRLPPSKEIVPSSSPLRPLCPAAVEEEEGAFGLWFTYLLCGVGGCVASYLTAPHTRMVSLGASGAVFGIFMVGVSEGCRAILLRGSV